MEVLWQSEIPGLPPPRRGKVRDVYDLGDALLIVASDRLSAYDHVLRPGILGKGKILNQLSNFWFQRLSAIVPNHLLATDPADFPAALRPYGDLLRGRSVLARKARVIPFECVARGFLAGSGYREYVQTGTVCGIPLPPGLQRASQLPAPVFTPATKAEEGHDENVDLAAVERALGPELAAVLRDLTIALYQAGAEHATARNLILADTKFEFGHSVGMTGEKAGELLLIDEVLTPDSSRYWDIAQWLPGEEPISFDKQFVRNWLDESGWDKESPPPELPADVVRGTLERYVEAFRRITGAEPEL
ncbi:MAG TPA: phosphoribosylaminoimidazolesuccinocarboxamide synthase [Thermoanaerobaculia bacterium]|jgi:phosphoribosylaminoimidazole-succinocarboxamide synthase|nr:phosphoribosylaminoimidazolesuccinocarboxamide synthase [Thermoanaerobaculia bacterium]